MVVPALAAYAVAAAAAAAAEAVMMLAAAVAAAVGGERGSRLSLHRPKMTNKGCDGPPTSNERSGRW